MQRADMKLNGHIRRRNFDLQPITAAEWNAAYKVGIHVVAVLADGTIYQTHTRSVAWEMDTGKAGILLEGLPDGHDLSRVAPW